MLFSIAVQKPFILMRPHLFIFSFMSLALGNISVKILLHVISEIFLPMFSSRTLMAIYIYVQFVFKSFIYLLSTYFCVWCKLMVEFQFFACNCPDLPTPFVEEAIFTPLYAPAPFLKY